MPIFTNQGAQDLADNVDYTPNGTYLGFGNNVASPGFGDFLDPGVTGGTAEGILRAMYPNLSAEQISQIISGQASLTANGQQVTGTQFGGANLNNLLTNPFASPGSSSGSNGTFANLMHGIGTFAAAPGTWLYNHTLGQLPGFSQASPPTDAAGNIIQGAFNTLGGYQQTGTPAMAQPLNVADSFNENLFGTGKPGELYGPVIPPSSGAGQGYSGSLPIGGPGITVGPGLTVNGGSANGVDPFGAGGPSYGTPTGADNGLPGMYPGGVTTLPAVTVPGTPVTPPAIPTIPSGATTPPTTINNPDVPTIGGNTGGPTGTGTINNPGTTNGTDIGPGTSGLPGTGTSGTTTSNFWGRAALPEGQAQNAAEFTLAPGQFSAYQQWAPQYAAQDTATLGTSLFGAGGPTNIADQYARLTQAQQDPLLQQQNSIASQLLSQGGNLSNSDLRNVQQATRAGYAARGLDSTNSAIVSEAMNTDAAQRNRLLQNLGIAQNVVGQKQAQSALTNANTSNLFGLANNMTTASNAYARNQFDPWSSYGQDVASSNFNALESRNNAANNNALALTIAGQNADAAKGAATTSALANIFGSWLGRCWIAREIYGAENVEWRWFRYWLERKAPKWFVEAYDQFGPEIAQMLHDNPKLKGGVKAFMDSHIAAIELEVAREFLTAA